MQIHSVIMMVCLPYIAKQLHQVSRLDVVWNIYKTGSMKSQTRASSNKHPFTSNLETIYPRGFKQIIPVLLLSLFCTNV